MTLSEAEIEPNSLCYLKEMIIDLMNGGQTNSRLNCELCEHVDLHDATEDELKQMNYHSSRGRSGSSGSNAIINVDNGFIFKDDHLMRENEFDLQQNLNNCMSSLSTQKVRNTSTVCWNKSTYDEIPSLMDLDNENRIDREDNSNSTRSRQYCNSERNKGNKLKGKMMIELLQKNSMCESLASENSLFTENNKN